MYHLLPKSRQPSNCPCEAPGKYITQNCTATSNQVCVYCDPNHLCPPGQYYTTPDYCYSRGFDTCVSTARHPAIQATTFDTLVATPMILSVRGTSIALTAFTLRSLAVGYFRQFASPTRLARRGSKACNILNDTVCVNDTLQPCKSNQFIRANRTNTSDLVC